MRKHLLHGITCSVLLALAAVPAAAQTWDMPSFFSPRPGEDLGVYAFKPDGRDWGIEGIWRQEGNLNLGVRVGLLDGGAVSIGSEFYKPLRLDGYPEVLVSYMLGAGATFDGDVTGVRIPFGVSIGTQLGQSGGGLRILPYVHPRVAFDYVNVDLGPAGEASDSDFNFDVDVGADVPLGTSWVLHGGATLTHGGVFGVGLAYRMSRKLIVR